MIRLVTAAMVLLGLLAAFQLSTQGTPQTEAAQWFRGNTHTHTLWSDGNAAPEWVAAWYAENDYDFLVLSDHNILSTGERWFPIEPDGRLTEERVAELAEKFGDEWVETRPGEPSQMRLKTLDELRDRFEKPGELLFIQGEEITDSFDRLPVHVNGLNLAELIEPQHGASVRETLQNNVDAVIEQSQRIGQPMLAHINHPNFGWGLTPEDVASVRGERFFEVYNGHSSVRNYGDAEHPSMEDAWDRALVLRLTELDLGLLYGMATDDSHQYFRWGIGHTNPGRGWVMVWAESLDPDVIVTALRRGDFYASSGVTLKRTLATPTDLKVDIEAEPDVTYTIRFIGTRRTADGLGETGEVLAETTGSSAVYRFQGDELYVRATVTSSEKHPNPFAEGDHQMAWVQPVVPGATATRAIGPR